MDMARTTWEKEDSLVQVEANGTPVSFSVAEFSISTLNLKKAFESRTGELDTWLKAEVYSRSDKKLCLI